MASKAGSAKEEGIVSTHGLFNTYNVHSVYTQLIWHKGIQLCGYTGGTVSK